MLQRLSIALTILNLILLALVLAERHAVSAQDDAPLLRGRGLEIVDERGRVRASISVHGPTTVDGQRYPGAVVFRLIDPNGRPNLKMDTSEEGAGLGVSADDASGVMLMAKTRKGTYVEVTGPNGRKQIVAPPR